MFPLVCLDATKFMSSSLFTRIVACEASVSVWFRSKERPALAAREMNESQKMKEGEGKEGNVSFQSSPPPSKLF